MRAFSIILFLMTTVLGYTKDLYKNDFEQNDDVQFYAVCAPRWIGSSKAAEKEGFIKIIRAGLSGFREKNHDGVQSYALEVDLLKGNSKWGPTCMFRGGNWNIPVKNDLWLSAFVYPETLPPDVSVEMGIIFTFEKNGKIVGGSLPISSLGKNTDNFLVYCAKVQDVLKNHFKKVTLKGWMLRLYSRKPFHGQKVRIFLDDVVLSDKKPDVSLTGLSNDRLGNNILKNSKNPYIVDYTSLYREYPKNTANVIFNSSFELGMKDWYPRIVRTGDSLELPDPAAVFCISESEKAPQGRRYFSIKRKGKASRTILTGRPYKIEDGKDYVLSFYAKASENGEILEVNHREVKLTDQWERYVVKLPNIKCYETWRKKKFPGRFNLHITNTGKADIDIDAIMLAKAPLNDYTASGILEIAAKPTEQFGLYGMEEMPHFKVEYYNSDNKKNNGKIYWELKDHLHRILEKGERAVSAEPQSGGSFSIPVQSDKNFYKLYVKLVSPGQPEQTTTTSAARIPDLSQVKNNEFFGHCALEGSNPANLKHTLDLSKKLGMSFAVVYHLNHPRATQNWRENNPLLKKIDHLLTILNRYNMEMIWSNYQPFPPNIKKDKNSVEIITPSIRQDITDFSKELAKRFKGKIKYYEYFGEYLKTPLGEKTKVVDTVIKAAFKGLKSGNQSAQLLAPGQNHMDNILITLESQLKLGTMKYVDLISLHPYGFGSNIEYHEIFARLMMLMKNNKLSQKFIGIESGTASTDVLYYDDICGESLFYPKYVTELLQAQYDVRGNIMMFGSRMFERNANFYPYEGNVCGRKFYHFINPDNGISPRPIFPAYAYMVKRLSGSSVAGEYQQRKENGFQSYVFCKAGKYFAAMWVYNPTNQSRRITLPIPSGKVNAYNMMGEKMLVSGQDQTFINLDGNIIWLDANGYSKSEFLAAMKNIRVVSPKLTLHVSSARQLLVTLDNNTPDALNGNLSVSHTKENYQIDIPVNQSKTFKFICSPTNHIIAYQAELNSRTGKFSSMEIRPLLCRKAPAKILLDGNLNEFKDAYKIQLDPSDAVLRFGKIRDRTDCSAELRLMYDHNNLYIAVLVKDDKHCAPHSSGPLLWANDALQLMFIMSGNLTNASNTNMLELAVADSPDGPAVSSTLLGQNVNTSTIKKMIKRDDTKGETFYEIAIPWNTLRPDFRPDKSIHPGFNLAISDNDGVTRPESKKLLGYEKSLQVSKGIVDGKNPATALSLVFE